MHMRAIMPVLLFLMPTGPALAELARATVADGKLSYTIPEGWEITAQAGYALHAEPVDSEAFSRCGIKTILIPNPQRLDQAAFNARVASRPPQSIARSPDKLLSHSTSQMIGAAQVMAVDYLDDESGLLFKIRHFTIVDGERAYGIQLDCVTQTPDNNAVLKGMAAFIDSARLTKN